MRSSDLLTFSIYFTLVISVVFLQWFWGLSFQFYADPLLQPAYQTIETGRELVSNTFNFLKERNRLTRTIRKLQRQNRALESELRQLQPVIDENRSLRDELNLPDRPRFRLQGADVIRSNLSDWERTVTLNRGTSGGVSTDDPVIDFTGDTWVLRGKVISASASHSTVLLTSDPRFKIGVQFESHPDRHFVAQGWGRKGLRVLNIPSFIDTRAGLKVYTTPISEIAPKNLLVGRLVKTPAGKNTSKAQDQSSARIMPITLEKPYSPLWILVDND